MPSLELYNILPEKSKLLKESIVAFCNAIAVVEIKSSEHYDGAVATAKELTAFERDAKAQQKEDKSPHQEKIDLINEHYKPVLESIDALKRKITAALRLYDDKKERERREEQRRLDELARKEREAKERAAAEERRKAEEARRANDYAKAAELEAAAASQEVEAAQVIAPVVQVERPQATGINTVTRWKMEITDPVLFVQTMIKENKQELVMPNGPAANKYAQMTKRSWIFPGGKVVSVQTSAVRT